MRPSEARKGQRVRVRECRDWPEAVGESGEVGHGDEDYCEVWIDNLSYWIDLYDADGDELELVEDGQ